MKSNAIELYASFIYYAYMRIFVCIFAYAFIQITVGNILFFSLLHIIILCKRKKNVYMYIIVPNVAKIYYEKCENINKNKV